MIRVFISGPLTHGGTAHNVCSAVHAADELMTRGYYPYVPHLSHFADAICPRRYEDWLRLDCEWLRQCQAVLRLPGYSPGADSECGLANELHMPVFFSIQELLDHLPPEERDSGRPSMPLMRIHHPLTVRKE